MTCIAWDGHTLAADKQVTSAGLARTVTKIARVNDVLYAITGEWSDGAELRAWHIGGGDPEKFPKSARDDKATLIAISWDQRASMPRVEVYTTGPHPLIVEDSCVAFGSGRDFALSAMHLGRSAAEAVKVAMHFETGCGMGVDVLDLQEAQE